MPTAEHPATLPKIQLPRFDLAAEMNADMIELDVQLTKDRQIVVIHDDRVDRTTNGSGFVKDFTLKEPQALDAGSWYGPAFQGEKSQLWRRCSSATTKKSAF